mmetsp:Transcript_6210/g.12835  ORF Transcript_6210/g.12835 Transcript_6210/m.12835 type:complete len:158 (-) Transcript_6210:181-654(-)
MSSTPNDCQSHLNKRKECYRKNDLGEYHHSHAHENKTKFSSCWIPILRAKRCLAFQHCAREAVEYYQSPSDKYVEGVNGPKNKGYCASYDEAFCFGNPRIMKIDLETAGGSQRLKKIRQEVFDHHERWKRRVTNSKLKQGRCEDMRSRLTKCLREHL